MRTIQQVGIRDEPGLYKVLSSSATKYYVDSRRTDGSTPLYMRWRGAGLSLSSSMDNTWHALIRLAAGPRELTDGRWLRPDEIDESDTLEWTLRVGSFHGYYTIREADHPNGPLYWVTSRVCEQIRVLDTMPDETARAGRDAWLSHATRVWLVAWATHSGEWWDGNVPMFTGLFARVRSFDDAADGIRDAAAALTGHPREKFVVTVIPFNGSAGAVG